MNLCASLGIVAGVGDGKFDPSATVTTAQAVLMLCRTLGYFQSATDFGNDWMLAATAKGCLLYTSRHDSVKVHLCLCGTSPHDSRPVSYTHLYVYKRQEPRFPAMSSPRLRSIRRPPPPGRSPLCAL